MSISGATGVGLAGQIPAVNQATEPSWVRSGSAETKHDYAAALAFEQTLVEQLSKSLTPSGEEGEEGGEGGSGSMDAGQSQLSSMLPQAFSSSIMNSGGLGLAAELTRGIQGTSAAGTTAPAASTGPAITSEPASSVSGGTPAPEAGA